MRCWRGLLALVFAAAALAAGFAPDLASAAEPFVNSCPAEAPEEVTFGGASHDPRTAHTLVPARAISVRICRYWGYGAPNGKQNEKTQARYGKLRDRFSARGRDLLESLTLEFAELEPVGKGAYNCPFDDGSRLFAVFGYPDGESVLVEVGLGGCRTASNGHAPARFASSSLIGHLERLLEGSRAGSAIAAVGGKRAVAFPPPHLSFAVAKHQLNELAEEGCEGRCTSWRLRHCRRNSPASVTCSFTGFLPGEVCRGRLTASELEGSGFALSASIDEDRCPARLFFPPELRERLEEEEREEAEERPAPG